MQGSLQTSIQVTREKDQSKIYTISERLGDYVYKKGSSKECMA